MSEEVTLGFGAMRLPITNEYDPESIDVEEFKRMVDYCIDNGFNYFDTSFAYKDNESEKILKNVLINRYPREAYKFASKMPTWLVNNEKDNAEVVNLMLKRLDLEYFDVFLLHNINKKFYKQAEDNNTFQYLEKMKEEGLARKIGIWFNGEVDLLEEILEKYGDILDIVQIHLNFLNWDNFGFQSRKCYDLCVQYDMEVVLMGPTKGSSVVNANQDLKIHFDYMKTTVSEISLRFAGSLSNVSVVLSDLDNFEQLKENCEVFKDFKKLTNGEHYFLMTMAKEINKNRTIPCDYCNFCIYMCPSQLPIPDFFNLYNAERSYSLKSHYDLYDFFSKNHSPASSCIECGICIESCHQQFDIPFLLKYVVKTFE